LSEFRLNKANRKRKVRKGMDIFDTRIVVLVSSLFLASAGGGGGEAQRNPSLSSLLFSFFSSTADQAC